MIKLLFDAIVKGSVLHGLRMLVDTKRIWVHFFVVVENVCKSSVKDATLKTHTYVLRGSSHVPPPRS